MIKDNKKSLRVIVAVFLCMVTISTGVVTGCGVSRYVESGKNTGENIEITDSQDKLTDLYSNEASADTVADIQSTASESLIKWVDVTDVVENAMKSVVEVNCVEYVDYNNYYGYYFGYGAGTKEVRSCGTGVIISRQDDRLLILTNNHVVEGAAEVSVVFADDKEVKASVLGTAKASDIALVSVAVSDIGEDTLQAIGIAVLGDSDNVRVGSAAIAIGNALGYGQSVTTGVISALNRDADIADLALELIQTDAAVNEGNSGGPLLNALGEVIGINSVKYGGNGVEGMCYAIPINEIKPVIEEILNNPKGSGEDEVNAERPYLGIYAVDITIQYQFMYGMPAGIYVNGVEKGSPAEAAGLGAGDIITSVDGVSVTTRDGLTEAILKYKPGDTIELGVMIPKRNSYYQTKISVVLGNSKDYEK